MKKKKKIEVKREAERSETGKDILTAGKGR